MLARRLPLRLERLRKRNGNAGAFAPPQPAAIAKVDLIDKPDDGNRLDVLGQDRDATGHLRQQRRRLGKLGEQRTGLIVVLQGGDDLLTGHAALNARRKR